MYGHDIPWKKVKKQILKTNPVVKNYLPKTDKNALRQTKKLDLMQAHLFRRMSEYNLPRIIQIKRSFTLNKKTNEISY